ncbi:hypothetical protein SacmaDRAFT_0576 [Saccharomonospora marina XMU15]|uniref:ESX secretion-associated protein EspG n=1 Tax=Saccharomonospora marina XMU15 TaxID=882083 RepID=H5X4D4_9PSEU|nr:ESX secretion-associated protein EspG [Saccharomonospora marina]EHR48877.1 hypothetical protein SacmaDRAFT_0576 [Saccharomonospora marina XMU15]
MRVELSLDTLLTAMSLAGCGEAHLIFAGGERYVPPSATDRVRREALDELAPLGLATGGGLDRDFEDALRTLGQPHTEYIAHVRAGDRQYGLLVAVRGRSATIAVREGARVRLNRARETDYAAMLVALLPAAAPADFTPFSVPRQEIRGEPTSHDARELASILARPSDGLGYLHVARRASGKRRTEATDAVCYVDAEAGRVGIAPTGGDHVAVFPGDETRLTARLAAVRATLR